ncbi:MAG: hypothetical protein IT561_20390 [Alphaproteobacteria bacterium]|nr:hypothetical protein [Alphaproteobacteria bacterium]
MAVHENWRDFPEALQFLTPGGRGAMGRVRFAPASEMPDADFVLVLNSPQTDGTTVICPPERLWFACGEPPERYHAAMHFGQGEGTVVLTCAAGIGRDPRFAARRTYITTLPMLRTWKVRRPVEMLDRMATVEKSRDLSWVTSNLRLVPGHVRRLQFLERLQGRVPFDLFGHGFAPIADKWDGVAPYRYSIAFENSAHPGYFSEKIMDCFVCLTMPIYVGTPAIGRFFPSGSFVTIDPDDPDVMGRIAAIVASDRRERAIDALKEARRLVLRRYNIFMQLARLMVARMAPPTPPRTFTLRRQRYGQLPIDSES